jgi:hypothetical protein
MFPERRGNAARNWPIDVFADHGDSSLSDEPIS